MVIDIQPNLYFHNQYEKYYKNQNKKLIWKENVLTKEIIREAVNKTNCTIVYFQRIDIICNNSIIL